jgi:GNAT superfamily N-acetyltransferase
MSISGERLTVRRRLRDRDPGAIVDLHERVYRHEFGRNSAFVDAVAQSVRGARGRGWPERGGAVWLIDAEGGDRLSGCLALTREGAGLGRVRWFVFEADLRGQGLGRKLLSELLCEAREQGMARLELDTFSALSGAAHLYRTAGFTVRTAEGRDDWGPPITYQHYELEL